MFKFYYILRLCYAHTNSQADRFHIAFGLMAAFHNIHFLNILNMSSYYYALYDTTYWCY